MLTAPPSRRNSSPESAILNLGIGASDEFGSNNFGLASGAAVGYEFHSPTFVELRYMANNVNNVEAAQLMVGERF